MWTPYHITKSAPWDLRRVVHLHRRAGFAATRDQIQRDLRDGPQAAVHRLVQGQVQPGATLAEFNAISRGLANAAVASKDPVRLKAWWLHRMLHSPDPLGERLTLMWHNHFATSNEKIDNLALMHAQNELFRTHARAPFGDLLTRVCKHPSMLIWLDAQANRKEQPNENLAREIMELFTLGVGNYSESDIKGAARALTGWTIVDGQFHFKPDLHDDGEKTILGQTGPFTGDDLIRILLEHPATARRLAWRICNLLMGEGAVDTVMLEALAQGLFERKLNVGWAVETVLRSEAFFAERNIAAKVQGPVEFIAGAVRALECSNPPPSTAVLSEWASRLGQDLFYPPNVFGWPGGRDWLTSRALIGRAKFADDLVRGALHAPHRPLDALRLAADTGHPTDVQSLTRFYCQLLLGTNGDDARDVLKAAGISSQTTPDPNAVNRIVTAILASPQAQLQ